MATRVTEISHTFRDDPRPIGDIRASLRRTGWQAADGTGRVWTHPDLDGQRRIIEDLDPEPEQSIDEAMGIRP